MPSPSAKRLLGSNAYGDSHVVVISDGFTQSQILAKGGFHDQCADFVQRMKNAAWMPPNPRLNVWRVDFPVDNDSPGELQVACDDQEIPPLPRSNFGARYEADAGGGCAAMNGDLAAVDAVIDQTAFDSGTIGAYYAIILVNYPAFGGSAHGDNLWTSNGPEWYKGAFHEFGHAFARLYDEYESPCETKDPKKGLATLCEENVTSYPKTPRWRNLFDPDTSDPVRKRRKDDCEPTSPPYPKVGAFQGAAMTHRKYYRPSLSCRMRDPNIDFCLVCVQSLRHSLDPSESSGLSAACT